MATETPAKATLQQRATHEIKELLILTVYLYITLGAVIAVKAAVLHTEGIEFAPWGVAIVKALVLAKFILVGDAMKIGEGHTGPLIWPTLHKALGFLLLLVILTIIEEAVCWTVPPPVDCRFARRSRWRPTRGNARRLPDHAAGAHSVFRFSGPRRRARERQVDADVLCRARAAALSDCNWAFAATEGCSQSRQSSHTC
ncbi:MAG TPA: hypothetical protein VFE60_10545 [Roseiarcus sp.]|nr:hypothetical protein [Roseiarcus sp.]